MQPQDTSKRKTQQAKPNPARRRSQNKRPHAQTEPPGKANSMSAFLLPQPGGGAARRSLACPFGAGVAARHQRKPCDRRSAGIGLYNRNAAGG